MIAVLAGVGLIALGALGVQPNTQFKDAAAVIAISGAVAIGIERVLEGFWTTVGLFQGTWFPMNKVAQTINGWVSELNKTVEPLYQAAETVISEEEKARRLVGDDLEAAKKTLRDFQSKATELQEMAPGDDRAKLASAVVLQSVAFVQKLSKDPKAIAGASAAVAAAQGVAELVATFKDNPGRRLISIVAGAYIGLAVAGILRIDLFNAILASPSSATSPITVSSGPYWGIVLTGLAMGLGSSPTHELVQALKEYKNNLKGSPATP